MVFSYDYSSRNRWQRRTNVPPSRAISMAMAVRRCDTERKARCSMTRASPEATERRHRAIIRLLALYCPGGRQGDNHYEHVPTLLAISMAIAMRRCYTPRIA